MLRSTSNRVFLVLLVAALGYIFWQEHAETSHIEASRQAYEQAQALVEASGREVAPEPEPFTGPWPDKRYVDQGVVTWEYGPAHGNLGGTMGQAQALYACWSLNMTKGTGIYDVAMHDPAAGGPRIIRLDLSRDVILRTTPSSRGTTVETWQGDVRDRIRFAACGQTLGETSHGSVPLQTATFR